MNGILLVDKPQSWTSNDVVMKLKGMLHERRIGHSGTLDPMATGLLVVFVGRATRAVEFAEAHNKRYIAGLRLGTVTDTQDVSGNGLSSSTEIPTLGELKRALSAFRGDIEQVPPMYSAIKINGKRLYDIARKGEQVERKSRHITISGLEIVGQENGDWLLDVQCSKGTYIRTLCNDIGEKLGCGGCMSSLRRIEAGCFSVNDAHKLSDVQDAVYINELYKLLIPVDSMFSDRPSFTAGPVIEKKIRVGASAVIDLPDGEYRVYSDNGEFLMLGRAVSGRLITVKSFFEV